MHTNQTEVTNNQVTEIFDRLVQAYGLNEGGAIHRALTQGEITPEIRSKVRAVTLMPAAQVTLH